MKRSCFVAALFTAVVFFAAASLHAAPFYQGKNVRITVGFSAGGGFDLWARMVARHIGKHIPGNPTVIVENVTGAGGLIQINQLFTTVKPDGLTLGHINGGLILSQVLGQPGYNFDPQKFIYVGAANRENAALVTGKNSGITSAEKWKNASAPVKIGAMVPGNFADNCCRMMGKGGLGYPTQVITGYKGSADILLAIEGGELAGGPASWDSMRANRKRQMDAGEMFVVVQCAPKPLNGIPNVPTMISLAQTEEQKKLVQIVVNDANEYSRPFAFPPGTPKERVDIMRQAFQDTMKDPELLAEVEKMQMTLDPTSAESLFEAVVRSTKMDQPLKEKLNVLLFGK